MQNTRLKNSAIVASILTLASPLELIKTRLQTNTELLTSGKIKQNYKSITHCVSSILRAEGIKSLWKGNAVGLARFFPNQSINLKSRQFLQKRLPNKFEMNVLSAVLSGWIASSLLYPVDILRLHLSNSIGQKTQLTSIMKAITKNHGFRYFFKGYFNSLVGTALFRGSFNGFYDTSKSLAKTLEEKTLIAYICAVTAGIICYPLDIVRRRRIISNENNSFVKFSGQIWRRQGVKGFYKGAKLILPQSIAGAAILLLFDSSGIFKLTTN